MNLERSWRVGDVWPSIYPPSNPSSYILFPHKGRGVLWSREKGMLPKIPWVAQGWINEPASSLFMHNKESRWSQLNVGLTICVSRVNINFLCDKSLYFLLYFSIYEFKLSYSIFKWMHVLFNVLREFFTDYSFEDFLPKYSLHEEQNYPNNSLFSFVHLFFR
jgi:hypothetical protein